MRIEVKGRNLQVTDELRECVERRMDKVARQVSDLAELELELHDARTPTDHIVAEATLRLKGTTLRATAASDEARRSIILVSEELARQVKRQRDKRRARREAHAVAERLRSGEAPPAELLEDAANRL